MDEEVVEDIPSPKTLEWPLAKADAGKKLTNARATALITVNVNFILNLLDWKMIIR